MRGSVIKNTCLFLVGFCSYITIEVVFRGYTFPLMGVCGGIAIVILDKINSKISWDTDILLQGSIGAIIITLMELIVGELSLAGLVPVMWDYSMVPFNYHGIICLPFTAAWFFLSIAAIVLADAINYYTFDELPPPYYKCCGKVVFQFRKRV